MVAQCKIIIHPRCRHLIYQLRSGTWNKKHTDFNRLPDIRIGEDVIRGGHCDGLDALIYLVRNLIKTKSPYPLGYDELSGPNAFNKNRYKDTSVFDAFRKMLNIKKLTTK